MLQDLTPASFEALTGTPFRVHYGGASPLEIVLYEVARHEQHPGPRQQPFSAYFRGPYPPVLPQRIYRVEHDQLGTLEIFLVPIGPDGQGMRYEAVFN
jgi:uncharacterized protein DUF6916